MGFPMWQQLCSCSEVQFSRQKLCGYKLGSSLRTCFCFLVQGQESFLDPGVHGILFVCFQYSSQGQLEQLLCEATGNIFNVGEFYLFFFFKYHSAIVTALGEALKKCTLLHTKQKFWSQNGVHCLLLSWLENCNITLWNVKYFLLWCVEPSQQLTFHRITCFMFPLYIPLLSLWKGKSK